RATCCVVPAHHLGGRRMSRAPSAVPDFSARFPRPNDTSPGRQGSLEVLLGIQCSGDQAHFVDSAVRISARGDGDILSDTQQNAIVGTRLHVTGEAVRQWRRGLSRPPYDRLLQIIVIAARKAGGEYALLAEIYGPMQAGEMWGLK